MQKSTPSPVGPNELRGLLALQHSIQTKAPLFRRFAFGLRVEPLTESAAYHLWSRGAESEIFCEMPRS